MSMASEDIRAPIFIWGCPRSGTTLLYSLLAELPGLRCPRDGAGRLREGTDAWWEAFGEHRGVLDEEAASPDRVRALREAYVAMVPGLETARLLDKSPFLTLWVPLIEEVFPDAHHVHIIRDGRAVVNSILFKLRHSDMPRDAIFQRGERIFGPQPAIMIEAECSDHARRHGLQWVGAVKAGMASKDFLGPRYHEVRYENLVAEPQRVIEKLCMAIEESVEPGWIERHVPVSFPNKNELWADPTRLMSDPVFTRYCSLTAGDFDGLTVMDPLLERLGYPEVGIHPDTNTTHHDSGGDDAVPRTNGFEKYHRAGAYHWTQSQKIWGNKRFNAPLVARYQAVIKRINPAGTCQRILDIGCGDGYLLHLAGQKTPDAELVGIDNEALGLRLAAEKLAEHGQQADLRRADCTNLPFPEASFDIAMLADVIEHLDHRETCLEQTCRVLRHDGVLLLSTPNRQPGEPLKPYHVYEYDRDELQDLLQRYFYEVSVTYAWPMIWMKRWRSRGLSRHWHRNMVRVLCQLGRNPFEFETQDPTGGFAQLIAEARRPRRAFESS